MSVFGAELYAASCALQYAASLCKAPPDLAPDLAPHSKVVSLSIDNQATISTVPHPDYPYLAPLLRDIRNATITLVFPFRFCGPNKMDTWAPRHRRQNDLADAATKLAAEGTPSANFPWLQ